MSRSTTGMGALATAGQDALTLTDVEAALAWLAQHATPSGGSTTS